MNDETKSNIAQIPIDEAAIAEAIKAEMKAILARKSEVKSLNKEISAAYDRIESKGYDKAAIKAWLRRAQYQEDQRERFDATLRRLEKQFGQQAFEFAA